MTDGFVEFTTWSMNNEKPTVWAHRNAQTDFL